MIPNTILRHALVLFALQALPMGASLRQKRHSPLIASVLSPRGGQSNDPYNGYPENNDDGFYNPPNDPDHLFQESVQDRVDKWRSEQMEERNRMSAMQQESLRDSQGRLKLLASVGKGSRALIFFILMWRDILLFEGADKALKGLVRLFAVVPLTILFLANLAGAVGSLSGGGQKMKKRLKAILNLDKIVEIILLFWYLLRLTVLPTKLVPREVFVASVLHSVFFIIQCQSFTRITW